MSRLSQRAQRVAFLAAGIIALGSGALAALGAEILLYPVVTGLWPDGARYYQILYSTYSPPLTLALIPVAFSVAAVRSARSRRAA